MTEAVRWHTDGNNPMAGAHEGRDAVWEHFFAFQWDAPVRVEDHDILDNGEPGREKGKTADETLRPYHTIQPMKASSQDNKRRHFGACCRRVIEFYLRSVRHGDLRRS